MNCAILTLTESLFRGSRMLPHPLTRSKRYNKRRPQQQASNITRPFWSTRGRKRCFRSPEAANCASQGRDLFHSRCRARLLQKRLWRLSFLPGFNTGRWRSGSADKKPVWNFTAADSQSNRDAYPGGDADAFSSTSAPQATSEAFTDLRATLDALRGSQGSETIP